MPTQRCEICHRAKLIEEKSICCSECEEKELDLLLHTYAFIHCFDADYCPIKELLHSVPVVSGIQLTQVFIRSWLMKNWLEKNELNSIRVPPPLYKELEKSGFSVNDIVRKKLIEQKRKKIQLNNVSETYTSEEESGPRVGMVYMEKKERK